MDKKLWRVTLKNKKKQDYGACLRLDINFIILRKIVQQAGTAKSVWITPSFGALTWATKSNSRYSEMNMRTQTVLCLVGI